MMLRNFITVLLLSAAIPALGSQSGPIYKTHLFSKGDNGYNTFRIPALVTTGKGTVLAFAEARKNSRSDTGDIDLVLKRSTDDGKTWSELIMVWDDGGNVCGNPSPVVDRASGRIILLSTWNLGTDHESDIHKHASEDTRRVYMLTSDDDGLTWSDAKEITDAAKKPIWGWYATGPCHSIQIQNGPHKGRIVVPCDHSGPVGNGDATSSYSHFIYSDDVGQTWNIGGISVPGGNESTVAELSDGGLMLNMRGPRGAREKGKCRLVAISRDGGATLEPTVWDQVLTEPVCQGTLLNYSPRGKITSTILFSNPNHPDRRVNMTIKISRDDGKTWVSEYRVFEGFTAYSDMAMLDRGAVGILYESGEESSYDRITFEKLPKKIFGR